MRDGRSAMLMRRCGRRFGLIVRGRIIVLGLVVMASMGFLPGTATAGLFRAYPLAHVTNSDVYKWNAEMVKIGSPQCSGVMISPNVVGTAGHCVYSEHRWRTGLSVTPAANDNPRGTPNFPYGLNFCVLRLITTSEWISNARDSFDEGAIKIGSRVVGSSQCQDNVNLANYVSLESSAPVAGDNIRVAGYPVQDNGQGNRYGSDAQWYSDCTVRSVTTYQLYYRCSTEPGMSGGPVFYTTPSTFTLLGVHTGGTYFNNGGTTEVPSIDPYFSTWASDNYTAAGTRCDPSCGAP
jgi:V8-like Glu-specific endopeptidase